MLNKWFICLVPRVQRASSASHLCARAGFGAARERNTANDAVPRATVRLAATSITSTCTSSTRAVELCMRARACSATPRAGPTKSRLRFVVSGHAPRPRARALANHAAVSASRQYTPPCTAPRRPVSRDAWSSAGLYGRYTTAS